MSLLKDKYKRRAALGTLLVHVFLIFIFYSFGLTYMDPKVEEGIALEFGYVEEGMGDEILQSEEIEPEQVQESVPEPEVQTAPSEEIVEELVTQDLEDAPVISQEETPEESQENQQEEEPEEIQQEASDELKNALSSLFQNTNNTNTGTTEELGAQGTVEGDVEGVEESLGGQGNDADGYELGDRKAIRKPRPNYTCNEMGIVVIRVWVNSEGITYKAELDLKNTTDTSPCLVREAKAAALETSWLADPEAGPTQIGSITYNFHKL